MKPTNHAPPTYIQPRIEHGGRHLEIERQRQRAERNHEIKIALVAAIATIIVTLLACYLLTHAAEVEAVHEVINYRLSK